MKQYDNIGLIPGPTRVHPEVLAALAKSGERLGSADIESDFKDDYTFCCQAIAKFANTENDVVILTGEGMVALWGALKSVLQKDDTVLAVSNGMYGKGLGEMAESLGGKVEFVTFASTDAVEPGVVVEKIKACKPKLVTMVHSDTPTGMLNPLDGIGAAAHSVGALFLVDIVSSFGGVPINTAAPDNMEIDLALIGSQKALSCPPDMSAVIVSDKAWKVIEKVQYKGYDALQPWHNVMNAAEWPYTPNWHGIIGLQVSLQKMLDEGMEKVFARHAEAARVCRECGASLGLAVYPSRPSPTVTCFKMPDYVTWTDLDKGLRELGVVVGCSFGAFSGKVFRIGHMGTQADEDLVRRGMDAVGQVLRKYKGK